MFKLANKLRNCREPRREAASAARRFCRDDSGNVAMIFGICLSTMCMMIGGAVDMGRWLNAREATFAAVDSAMLAAGRALQTGSSSEAALALAQRVYRSNVAKRIKVMSDTIKFVISSDGATISTRARPLSARRSSASPTWTG